MVAPIIGRLASRLATGAGAAARRVGVSALEGMLGGKDSAIAQTVVNRLGSRRQQQNQPSDGFTIPRSNPTQRETKSPDRGISIPTSSTVDEALSTMGSSLGEQVDVVSQNLTEAGEAVSQSLRDLEKQVSESLTRLERALKHRSLSRRAGSDPGAAEPISPKSAASGEKTESSWRDWLGGTWNKVKSGAGGAATKGKGLVTRGAKGLGAKLGFGAKGLVGGVVGTALYMGGEAVIDWVTKSLGEGIYGKEKMDKIRRIREESIWSLPAWITGKGDEAVSEKPRSQRRRRITFRASDMVFDFGTVTGLPRVSGGEIHDFELDGSPGGTPGAGFDESPGGTPGPSSTARPSYRQRAGFDELVAPTGSRPLQPTGTGGEVAFRNPFQDPSSRGIQPFAPPGGADPMTLAATMTGNHEVRNREALKEYLRNGGVNLDPATLAWCAAFVNASLAQAGIEGTGSNMARSFMNWGEATDDPQKGDIVVFSRGAPGSGSGHVGFFEGFNEDGSIRVLGGNQGNQVKVSNYSRDRLLGFRRVPRAPQVEPRSVTTTTMTRPAAQVETPRFLVGAEPQPQGAFVSPPPEAPPPPAEPESKKKIVVRRPGQKWDPADPDKKKKEKKSETREPGDQVKFSEYLGVSHVE